MEDNKTKEEILDDDYDFIVRALNAYWHEANDKLMGQLGDIERQNYEYQKRKAKELMDRPQQSTKQLQDRIVELEIKNQAIESEAIDLLKDRVKELEGVLKGWLDIDELNALATHQLIMKTNSLLNTKS